MDKICCNNNCYYEKLTMVFNSCGQESGIRDTGSQLLVGSPVMIRNWIITAIYARNEQIIATKKKKWNKFDNQPSMDDLSVNDKKQQDFHGSTFHCF
ncbi:hypothetical protein LOAG_09801 [Loa loa]|uniref:Uncharacterized protein n=1 Tax=Loa loa TaxID=7209 RepID=A0A1S0TSP7_LOALO|nr:hypothetical protein LOAG_09801 [Loa loa]EFO18695.2 hypothetical protein LOAG_09801 [Loa loa]